MTLRSARERLIQSLTFEAGGLLLSIPMYATLSGARAQDGAMLLGVLTLAVMIWSPLHNSVFDWLDLRLTGRTACQRPTRLRIVHAVSHETSAVSVTLPIMLVFGGLSVKEALLVNLGLTAFYTVYAYAFHMAYDRLRPVAAVMRPALPSVPLPVLILS